MSILKRLIGGGNSKDVVPAKSETGTAVTNVDPATSRFLAKVATKVGDASEPVNIVVANDLTGSRDWNLRAIRQILGELFTLAEKSGAKINIGLANFTGQNYGGIQWVDIKGAQAIMNGAETEGGGTQISSVLKDTAAAAKERKIAAFIYSGDTNDGAGDNSSTLLALAQKVTSQKVPLFMFHEAASEGENASTARLFQDMVGVSLKNTGQGVFDQFRPGAMAALSSIFKAVIAISSGNARLIAAARSDKSITGRGAQLLLEHGKK